MVAGRLMMGDGVLFFVYLSLLLCCEKGARMVSRRKRVRIVICVFGLGSLRIDKQLPHISPGGKAVRGFFLFDQQGALEFGKIGWFRERSIE